MKLTLIMVFLFSSIALAAPEASKRNLPVTEVEKQIKKDKLSDAQKTKLLAPEEDCDEKIKKSLSGNAGCTLDEAKP